MTWLSDDTVRHLREVVDSPVVPGGRYEVRERIGRGGMGAVYRTHDRHLHRDVALKVVLSPEPEEQLPGRLLREARILARLEHPGIVPVHDAGRLEDGRTWYTMKLVRGARLDAHARTHSLPERLRLFLRIVETVAFAHAHGVVHRDLKPSNVMVGPFGEVLVLDWGVAKVREEPEPGDPATAAADVDPHADTKPGTVLGTPGYMSPEQARGRPDLADSRSDVYGLGGILADLLPEGEPVPRPLAAIRDRARAADPGRRYPDAPALADDVARFLDGSRVLAHAETAPERLLRWVRKYRVALLLVVAYLVARILILLLAGT